LYLIIYKLFDDTQAHTNSLCGYDVDHIFPRSRGGRATTFNATGVLHAANAYVKKDLILQSINPQHMLVGISATQLMSLFSFIESGDQKKGNNFMNRLHYVVFTLEMAPQKTDQFFNFQKRSNGTSDGEELFNILLEYHKKNIPLPVVIAKAPIGTRSEEDTESENA
jgi:hypothetical protein